MKFSIHDIARLSGASLVSFCDTDETVTQIFYDTRRINQSKGGLFVALKGDNSDGHDFIEEAYNKGIRNFLIEDEVPFVANDTNILQCENTLLALGAWAKNHRENFDIPLVMITGSYGKTSIKEWAFHFLSAKYSCLKSPKSYNSKIGVALSLLKLNPYHEIALIEAGISMPDEMQYLLDMCAPSCVLLSNIGGAHLENFESAEELKKEKLIALSGKTQKISTQRILDENGISGLSYYPNEKYEALAPFDSDWKNKNYLAAVALAELYEISVEEIASRTKNLPQIAHRLERLEGINGSVILNDSYILDADSLSIAISDFEALNPKRSFLVLSDMDKANESSYKTIEQTVRQKKWDGIYVLGGAMTSNLHKLGIHSFAHPQQIINDLKKKLQKGDGILIKGARKFELERVARALADVKHKTYLEVNLSQLGRNLKLCKEKLAPKTKVMAMVKAFAYGSGSGELAQYLEKGGVDYFGVAFSDEGKNLRESGITKPIMVLNSSNESFETIWEYKLEPAIFSMDVLDSFIRFCIDKGAQSYPIHLEFDTGMHRLGFEVSQAQEIVELIHAQPEVKIASVFTHLAASDSPKEDAFTRQQISKFEKVSDYIKAQFPYPIAAHCANSAAAARFKSASFDMVRLGISLYGYNPFTPELKAISQLHSSLTQIKKLNPGDSVGYDRAFIADKETLIGILPIGYADGFNRNLSQGVGEVYANGKFYPVVGNVCMDMCMIEIDDTITTETEFEIFGPHISLINLAEKMGTIPYEVLTSISSRVKRVFVEA